MEDLCKYRKRIVLRQERKGEGRRGRLLRGERGGGRDRVLLWGRFEGRLREGGLAF